MRSVKSKLKANTMNWEDKIEIIDKCSFCNQLAFHSIIENNKRIHRCNYHLDIFFGIKEIQNEKPSYNLPITRKT